VAILGRPAHEELKVTAPDVPVDAGPEYVVRSYTQLIGLASGSPNSYTAVADTRSFLGVYVNAPYRPAPGQYASIVAVAPGSPALGALHAGETIISVWGTPTPPRMDTPEGDGVLSVAQLAMAQPGSEVEITVSDPQGRSVARVRLSSMAAPAAQSALAKYEPGNYPLI
jgi:hypothetical protein